MQAADRSGDPLVLASASRAGTHALLAVGRFDDVLSLGNTASEWLAPQMARRDPSALSLYGMLHLRTAIAAARRQNRQTATELLRRASSAARSLNEDGNCWQTASVPRTSNCTAWQPLWTSAMCLASSSTAPRSWWTISPWNDA
ncbi:hypothetical protein [Salinifilum aidingensis]